MALRMAKLIRAKNGDYHARKVIPADVKDAFQRLYGVKSEAILRVPSGASVHERKVRFSEWLAEIETRIAALRASAKGEGRPLTRLQAIALAGRWYTWFLSIHEADLGEPRRWREFSDHLAWRVIHPEAPEDYHENPKADPHWEWQKAPQVRDAVRPQIAELARVATFLASEGVALDATAHALFVDAVSDNLPLALTVLERRANGDYSRDDTPDSFPEFTEGPQRGGGASCWELFEAYVTAVQPAQKTVARWRAVFLKMQREFAEVGADGITEDAARKWVHGLVSDKLSALTVRNVWLAASGSVFSWAREHKRIRHNPFKEVRVDVPRRAQTREDGRSFSAQEARTILKASLGYDKPATPTERARRWVPWLCAYSGARAGEITQLRGVDIEEREGVYVMKLTPDAGTIKTGKVRVVPLHEHIIEQGFVAMVKAVGKGALFYNDATPQRMSADPLKPSRSRADTTRAHLGTWVRDIGVSDPGLSPNHAWRHTFKRIADEADIPEKMNDAITGHTQASEGRKYGAPTVAGMAEALKKFPRYTLD